MVILSVLVAIEVGICAAACFYCWWRSRPRAAAVENIQMALLRENVGVPHRFSIDENPAPPLTLILKDDYTSGDDDDLVFMARRGAT
jgi:hypothetical protein